MAGDDVDWEPILSEINKRVYEGTQQWAIENLRDLRASIQEIIKALEDNVKRSGEKEEGY